MLQFRENPEDLYLPILINDVIDNLFRKVLAPLCQLVTRAFSAQLSSAFWLLSDLTVRERETKFPLLMSVFVLNLFIVFIIERVRKLSFTTIYYICSRSKLFREAIEKLPGTNELLK